MQSTLHSRARNDSCSCFFCDLVNNKSTLAPYGIAVIFVQSVTSLTIFAELLRKTIDLETLNMASSVFAFDLSGAPRDVIMVIFQNMDLKQRFTCALVCWDWARAAATHSIIRHGKQDLKQLQQWLDKHGSKVETLQLHKCTSTLARLPSAQLQDLLLHSVDQYTNPILSSRVWSDIAAATKLTSMSLMWMRTESEQADVVSALTALPDLQQLTWWQVIRGGERELSDSRLLQQLTRLTGLELGYVAAEALQHLSVVTKLQRLSMHSPSTWAADGYPGLQELRALTSLVLRDPVLRWFNVSGQKFPACVSHLTALQQLEVSWATLPELNGLTALTALTKLHVANISPSTTPLRLSALQQLILTGKLEGVFHPLLHTSSLASCTQLRTLSLCSFDLTGPGSLDVHSMLQELDLQECGLSSGDDGPAAMSPWELIFPGPGRLPHLTSLVLRYLSPGPQQADVERLVECCSDLRQLKLDSLIDGQCSSLVQLTGLRRLQIMNPRRLSSAGLRHLARLEQLTSLGFGYLDSREVSTELQEQLSDTVLGCEYALVNKAPAGSPPDVAARLLRACDMAAGGQQQH